MNIGIYIYDEVEVLDSSGPFEVFSTASRISKMPNLFSIFLISETGKTVTARGGYEVNPTYSISNHPSIDCKKAKGVAKTVLVECGDLLLLYQVIGQGGQLCATGNG